MPRSTNAVPTKSSAPRTINYTFERKQSRSTDLTDKIQEVLNKVLTGGIASEWHGDGNFLFVEDIDPVGKKIVTQTLSFTFEYTGSRNDDIIERHRNVIDANIGSAIKKAIPGGVWHQKDDEGNTIGQGYGSGSSNPCFVTWEKLADLWISRSDPLWNATYADIADHPTFSHIYGQEHVIRSLIRAIHHAISSGGKHCAHTLLWGEPGAAKSTILDAVIEYVNAPVIDDDPEYAAVEKLDADSSTTAGVTNRILNLANGIEGCPPLLGFEEAEKVGNDAFWNGLLSVFDYRQMISKLNNRGKRQASTPMLGLATVNALPKFESFCSGAIASRFSNRIEVARPDPDTMTKILLYKINEVGGDPDWADAAMELAFKYRVRDPRQIINFLTGREGLLDGTYQEDYERNIRAREQVNQAYEREEKSTDDFMDRLYSNPYKKNGTAVI